MPELSRISIFQVASIVSDENSNDIIALASLPETIKNLKTQAL